MTIVITGASGFIGKPLVDYLLLHSSAQLKLVLRRPIVAFEDNPRIEMYIIDSLTPTMDWSDILADCAYVIHTAARVHVMDKRLDLERDYQALNYESTLHLAEKAEKAGVKRFIYLSTIKVHGEYTLPDAPFKEADKAAPEDFYAQSKYDAEQGLLGLAKKGLMEVVIIRPPLVYGPGVKGNFLQLLQWMRKGIPLPLGALKHNKRSLVSIANLVDFIHTCMLHPKAANQIFLVSDNCDLSTTELLIKIRAQLRRKTLLVPVPEKLLILVAALAGKKEQMARLSSSLQVDIAKAQNLLGWKPVESMDAALASLVRSVN